MEVGGQDVGRITFELRADVAPKTAENFVSKRRKIRYACVGLVVLVCLCVWSRGSEKTSYMIVYIYTQIQNSGTLLYNKYMYITFHE